MIFELPKEQIEERLNRGEVGIAIYGHCKGLEREDAFSIEYSLIVTTRENLVKLMLKKGE